MINYVLLLPPVAFFIILIFVWLQIAFFGKYGCKSTSFAPGKGKQYACGEDVPINRINPEYRQFFLFAFFFTIMHVAALVITTYPAADPGSLSIAFLYILGAITGLVILFRR